MKKCGKKTEVYSRVTGYFRPVSNWNAGKQEEFKNRRSFELSLTGAGMFSAGMPSDYAEETQEAEKGVAEGVCSS